MKTNKKHNYLVDGELKPIMGRFLLNRRKDVVKLKKLLTHQDWVSMSDLAHQLRGSSYSYGFKPLSELGAELEEVTNKLISKEIKNIDVRLACLKIKSLIQEIEVFNKTVKVKFKKAD